MVVRTVWVNTNQGRKREGGSGSGREKVRVEVVSMRQFAGGLTVTLCWWVVIAMAMAAIVSAEIIQTFVLHVNREIASLDDVEQVKIKINMTNFSSIDGFLLHLQNDPKLHIQEGERIVKLEVYNKKLGTFLAMDRDVPFAEFLSVCNGPTQLAVYLHDDKNDEKLFERSKSCLMLKGRMLNIAESGLPIANTILRISSPGEADRGTGLTIWDGSIVLAKYFESNPHLVIGCNILEVGSGTGIVGIVAGLLGAKKVILTDLPYALDNLNVNIHNNRPENVDSFEVYAKKLDWFDPHSYPADEQWDIIVGADVVWVEDLIIPLVNTLTTLAHAHSSVLIAHQVL